MADLHVNGAASPDQLGLFDSEDVKILHADPDKEERFPPEAKEPESKPEPKVEAKPPEPEESEATKRLKQQLADLERSNEISRQAEESRRQQQQAEAAYLQYLNSLFGYWKDWKANGLSGEQEQFLLTHDHNLINQLTQFASQEAAKQHQVGTPEHEKAGQKLFLDRLEHLRAQASQHAPQQPAPENNLMPTNEPPGFPAPSPAAPRPRQEPSRRSIVSAPVSRDAPGASYRDDLNDPSKVRLSVAEQEAARISGVSLREYAEQKL